MWIKQCTLILIEKVVTYKQQIFTISTFLVSYGKLFDVYFIIVGCVVFENINHTFVILIYEMAKF